MPSDKPILNLQQIVTKNVHCWYHCFIFCLLDSDRGEQSYIVPRSLNAIKLNWCDMIFFLINASIILFFFFEREWEWKLTVRFFLKHCNIFVSVWKAGKLKIEGWQIKHSSEEMPELFAQISYLNLCCEMAQTPLPTNQTCSKVNCSAISSSVSLLQKFPLMDWLDKCACVIFLSRALSEC